MTPKHFRDAKMTEELRSTPNGLVIDWSRVKNDSKNYAVPPSCLFTIGQKAGLSKNIGKSAQYPPWPRHDSSRAKMTEELRSTPCGVHGIAD